MKLLVSLLITSACLVGCATNNTKKENKLWTQNELIKNPESVLYDKNTGYLYVSNVDGEGDGFDQKGHISILDTNGNVVDKKWVSGLNGPKGSRIFNETLWVSDINRVVKIDLKTGKVLKMIYIKGSKFLNDIAIDSNGVVYISDTLSSKIYKIENDVPSVFVKGDKYQSPNGLLIKGSNLYVAAWGLTTDWSTKIVGHLYSIDLNTKIMTQITKTPLGNLDGLEFHKDGDFLVSDWVNGKIYKVTIKGDVDHIYTGVKGTADIGYIPSTDNIIVPDMVENQVYSL